MRPRRLVLAATCALTILTGAISTLTIKAAYDTKVGAQRFTRPLFMELLVGVGMTLSLAAVPFNKRSVRLSRRTYRKFLRLPALATSDLTVGLLDVASILYAPASVISIVNCSILIFSTATTRIVVGTRYSWAHVCGIGTAALGVAIVGYASISAGHGGHDKHAQVSAAATGVLLSLGARALQAVQFAFEERFMKGGIFSPCLLYTSPSPRDS